MSISLVAIDDGIALVLAVIRPLIKTGAAFPGLIAVLPLTVQAITGITALAIGGTALLIAVAVVLDLMKKIDAQVSLREY